MQVFLGHPVYIYMFAGMAQKACPIWLNFLKGTHAHTGGDIVKMAGVSLNNNKKISLGF